MTEFDPDGKAADMRDRAGRFTERVAKIRGKGTRLNGRLVFEVDAQKNPARVSMDDSVSRYNPDSVAELVKGAALDACRDVERQIQEALLEFGDDSETRSLVRELMGPLHPGDHTSTPAVRPAPPPAPDEDEWEPPTTWLQRS